jgi:hypothetical protein
VCSFTHHLKYKKGKYYQSAVCKIKMRSWLLVTGMAYDKSHKAVTRFRSQSGQIVSEAHAFFMRPRLTRESRVYGAQFSRHAATHDPCLVDGLHLKLTADSLVLS